MRGTAETDLWAWSRADSARLAIALVVAGAIIVMLALQGLVATGCPLGLDRVCPSATWVAVPFGLPGFTLVVAGLWLRMKVKSELGT